MTFSISRFTCAFLVFIAAALPCGAGSFASSASSAASDTVGSLSDSIKKSSGSSTNKVMEGDYRILDVTADGLDIVRLKMQHVAHADDEDAVIYLDVPRVALTDRAAARGDIVGVRQRPYGYEFAWANTHVAFFLALSEDWRRELDPRPVEL